MFADPKDIAALGKANDELKDELYKAIFGSDTAKRVGKIYDHTFKNIGKPIGKVTKLEWAKDRKSFDITFKIFKKKPHGNNKQKRS